MTNFQEVSFTNLQTSLRTSSLQGSINSIPYMEYLRYVHPKYLKYFVKGFKKLYSTTLVNLLQVNSSGGEMEKTSHVLGQRILLNGSSVFYFLENTAKSPLQCLFRNPLSCIRMSVFSPDSF